MEPLGEGSPEQKRPGSALDLGHHGGSRRRKARDGFEDCVDAAKGLGEHVGEGAERGRDQPGGADHEKTIAAAHAPIVGVRTEGHRESDDERGDCARRVGKHGFAEGQCRGDGHELNRGNADEEPAENIRNERGVHR